MCCTVMYRCFEFCTEHCRSQLALVGLGFGLIIVCFGWWRAFIVESIYRVLQQMLFWDFPAWKLPDRWFPLGIPNLEFQLGISDDQYLVGSVVSNLLSEIPVNEKSEGYMMSFVQGFVRWKLTVFLRLHIFTVFFLTGLYCGCDNVNSGLLNVWQCRLQLTEIVIMPTPVIEVTIM